MANVGVIYRTMLYPGDEEVLSDYATKEELEQVSGSGLTEEAVQGLIESSLEGYATKEDIEESGHMTSEMVEGVVDGKLEGYLTAEEASETYQEKGDYLTADALEGYAREEDIPDLDGYATQAWVGEQGYLTEVPEEYVTEDELEGYAKTSDIPDVSGYATTEELAGYATKDELENYATTESLSAYATVASLGEYATASALEALAARVEALESASSEGDGE